MLVPDGEEFVRIFDPDKIESKEIAYEGNGEKKQKFEYIVRDPGIGEIEAFRASIKTSRDIDALSIEGYYLLKIRREGPGRIR